MTLRIMNFDIKSSENILEANYLSISMVRFYYKDFSVLLTFFI